MVVIKEDYNLIHLGWLGLVFGVALGIPLSLLFSFNFEKASDFMIGGWGGIALFEMLYSLLSETFQSIYIPNYLHYITIATVFICFGTLTLFNRNSMLILGTSFNGAYTFGKVFTIINNDLGCLLISWVFS